MGRYGFLFFILVVPLFAENGVPPLRDTPQMEGFFTEDDRDFYEYDALQEELQRRAEEKGYYYDEPPPYEPAECLPPQEIGPYFGENEVPPLRDTPQMEGFFTEDDRDFYEYDALQEELQRRAEEKGYYYDEPPPRYGTDENLPPQAKGPKKPEEQEDKEYT